MVAFTTSPIDTLLQPATRARAPSRTCTAVPTLPCKPNSRCDLRETKLAPNTRWGSRSRDPIGYADGVVLYQYVHARPVVNVDPSGNEDIEFPYPIDLPEERPAYADFHYQQSKCKKPSDCLVDCDKPEDWCRFFFVFVGHPKGAQFQIYHQKSGKCGADINRTGKTTFIEIVFKDRLSCRLVPNDFPENEGEPINLPLACLQRIAFDPPPPNNKRLAEDTFGQLINVNGDIAKIKYKVELEIGCQCGGGFPDEYQLWGPLTGEYKFD